MQINVIYDSSASAAPAAFKIAINNVINLLDAVLTNPITVSLNVGWGEVAGQSLDSNALGESESVGDKSYSYAQILKALNATAQSTNEVNAYATLPATNPSGRASYEVTPAQALALGLVSSYSGTVGYVGFSSNVAFSYTAGVKPAYGAYYFMGVAEHEITEILGRIANLSSSSLTVMDLFRYSAPGVRDLTTTPPSPYSTAYFSIDGGNTNLANWNTNSSGDYGDWSSSVVNDSFDAFSTSGVLNGLSAVDYTNMDVLGYHTAAVATGNQVVSSGQTVSGLVVPAGSTLQVSGGTVTATTVLAGGQENVLSGGFDNGATVNGGTQTVQSGGTVSGTVVSGGGQLNLLSGGTAANISIQSGGQLSISGGTLTGLTIAAGGSATVASGGVLTLSPGITAQNVTVASGGEIIFAGGTVSGLTVGSGATEAIGNGATLEVAGANAGVTVLFSTNQGTLILDNPTTFAGVIANLALGDQIDLRGVIATTATSGGNVLSVTSSTGGTINFSLQSSSVSSTFAITSDGVGGSYIVPAPTAAVVTQYTIVGSGINFLATGEQDSFVRTSAGQLDVLQFNSAGQIVNSQALTYNGIPTAFDPTATVVGSGSNYFGGGDRDVFFRTSNGQLNIWEFTTAGQLVGAQALTYNNIPTAFDPTATVIGVTTNYSSFGEHDVFFRTSNGQLNLWEFTTAGQLVGAQAFVYGTVPTAFDPTATVVGVTTNYSSSDEHDLFFRTGNGQLNIWEFTGAGQLVGAQAFVYSTVPTAFDPTAAVVGVTTNYSGGGEHDLFFRTGNGQLNIWEFTAAGQLVGAQAFVYGTVPTAFDPMAAVVGVTTNYSGSGEHDVFFRTGNGQLNIWEFTAAGQLVGAQAFVYNTVPTAFDPTAAVVGVGTNFSGGGEHDVFFRTGSGQLNIWEFNAAGQLIGALGFTTAGGGPFTVSATATVTSAGHDSLNGKSALALQVNGQSALYDLTGSTLSVAPSGAFLDPLVLNLTGGAVQTTSEAASGVTFDMQGDGSRQQTGWITQGEGFLVADPSGAPIISRAQMFSDLLVPGVSSGLAALATYDTNGDGKITAGDTDFKDIDVWVPGTGNNGQLYTLDQLGIVEIDLQKTAIDTLNNGNEILNGFAFQYADGASGQGAEVGFAASADLDSTGAALSQLVQAIASLTPAPALTTVADPMVASDAALQAITASHR